MKNLFYIVFSVISALSVYAGNRLHIIDDGDKSPVVAATVFSRSGNIIGITDEEGVLTGCADGDCPLTIRCVGYAPEVCERPTGIVALSPAVYDLAELTVIPAQRPVLKMLCHIREINTGSTITDTILHFNEHMAHFYLPVEKVKKFNVPSTPFVRTSRHYLRHADARGDSVSCPEYDDVVSLMKVIGMETGNVEESDRIRSGANTDTIRGKHGLSKICRKTESIYLENADYLADKKGHCFSPVIFRLLGLAMDLNELRASLAYRVNDSGTYSPADLLYATWSVRITGKGKWFKKAFNSQSPVEMNGYYEIYPVDFEYITVEEAKEEATGSAPLVEFRRSPSALPLPQAIQSLVDRCDALEKGIAD